jgi:hypothetical protein
VVEGEDHVVELILAMVVVMVALVVVAAIALISAVAGVVREDMPAPAEVVATLDVVQLIILSPALMHQVAAAAEAPRHIGHMHL